MSEFNVSLPERFHYLDGIEESKEQQLEDYLHKLDSALEEVLGRLFVRVAESVDSPTTGNLTKVDEDGQMVDSGVAYDNLVLLSSNQTITGVKTFPSLVVDNNGTGSGVYTSQDGVLAAGKHGLEVYSNAAHTTADTALVMVDQNSAGASEPALEIHNDGTGAGIEINQDGGAMGITVYQNAESAGINITNASVGYGMFINQIGIISGTKAALFVRGTEGHNQTAGAGLVKFHMDDADSTIPVLDITNDGTGTGLKVDQNGNNASIDIEHTGTVAAVQVGCTANAPHLHFSGDPTVASPVNGNVWFDGTNLKIRIGATTYNLDKTAE